MDNKDEYIFFINQFKTRFYYKNKRLHRENGPAVVISEDKDKYINLEDKDLYKEVFEPVIQSIPNNKESNIKEYLIFDGIHFMNTLPHRPGMISHYRFSIYYWDGTPYSKEQFEIIKLKNELENNMIINESTETRTKV
jgi:hypothetical protein